jgi:GT2 family glycosyltransferase
MKRFVVGAVATYKRPLELARLLESLKNAGVDFGAVVIADNGNDPAARQAFESSGIRGLYLPQSVNAGCSGGLRVASMAACEQFKNEMTHLWILDDDAVVLPGTLGTLLDTMERNDADAACPMTLDGEGNIGWFPGLIDGNKLRAIRDSGKPEIYVAHQGGEPAPFSWSTGVALLVSRRAISELGFHRGDYWIRGEDLEFSLRITHRYKGIFVPAATVLHIQAPVSGGESRLDAYLKHCAMLQNLCYTSLHLPHGRRIARTIPGNFWRFFKTWPLKEALPDAMLAFWLGAILAKPAGTKGAEHFHDRLQKK